MIDANELLRQLGGNKFIAMTGARDFAKGENTVSFRFMKGKNNITHLRITLNSMDTYDLEFGKIFKHSFQIVKVVNGVYNDQLQEIFTETTGLNTHL